MKEAALQVGVEEPRHEDVRFIIGLALPKAVRMVFKDQPDKICDAIVEAYKEIYVASKVESRPFEGVAACIEAWKANGYLVAVATGKSAKGLQRHLVEMQWEKFFHCTRCADQTASKPDPQMLAEICQELSVEAHEAVMIGDTTHDLEMAQRFNMPSAGVLCGSHPEQELLKFSPHWVAKDVTKLPF
jgi:phosphoglycolate phosphatase